MFDPRDLSVTPEQVVKVRGERRAGVGPERPLKPFCKTPKIITRRALPHAAASGIITSISATRRLRFDVARGVV